jgi:hypothetical protein
LAAAHVSIDRDVNTSQYFLVIDPEADIVVVRGGGMSARYYNPSMIRVQSASGFLPVVDSVERMTNYIANIAFRAIQMIRIVFLELTWAIDKGV